MDLGKVSFLQMIMELNKTVGTQFTKGSLMRTGLKIAEKLEPMEFSGLDDWVKAVKEGKHPLFKIEGESHRNDGDIFSLSCPFAQSVRDYVSIFGPVSEEGRKTTIEFNKPSKQTEDYRVGFGSAISPYCIACQTTRSSFGDRIKIDGKQVKIYQLGAKRGDGHKALSEKWIDELNIDKKAVEKILDNSQCCYAVRME